MSDQSGYFAPQSQSVAGGSQIRPVFGGTPPPQPLYYGPGGRGSMTEPPLPGAPHYATWSQRVGASLLDSIAVVGLGAVGVLIHGIIGAVVIVSAILFALWNQYYRQGTVGQTIGKSQVGIYLRRESDGAFIGVGMCILRGFAHTIDGFFYVGYLWPIWDRKHQTFADKICATVVVCS